MTYSLFIGRFQPFHNGHLQVITDIINSGEKVIIAVGSAQVSHTPTDPFTAHERLVMIKRTLVDAGISAENYWLMPIQDINQNQIWVKYLQNNLPEFNKIYSGSTLVKQLFRENSQIQLEELPRHNGLSATKIRNLIANNDPTWEKHTPAAVAKYIKEKQLAQRVSSLMQSS